MQPFAYYLFLFLAAAAISSGAAWGLSRFVKKLLLLEYYRVKRRFKTPIDNPRRYWLSCCLALLASSLAASQWWLGRPTFGLLVVFLFPLAIRGVSHWIQIERQRKLERSSLSFFYALSGLIAVGKSLPAALMEISRELEVPFTQAFLTHLNRYDEGRSLPTILNRFRYRTELKRASMALVLLEMAYRNGLSVAPLLDRMVPLLESEYAGAERVRSLRRTAAVQATIAFCAPWFLLWALHLFEPESLVSFLHSPAAPWVLAASILTETIGVGSLWQVSGFY